MNISEIYNIIYHSITFIEAGEDEKAIEGLDKILEYFCDRFKNFEEMQKFELDTKDEQFRKFLKRNHDEVMKWPEWKRNVLGKIPNNEEPQF